MKKFIIWPILSILGMVTSCTNDETALNENQEGNEIVTTIGLSVPESLGSRTVPDIYGDKELAWIGESGYPSIGNVDLNDHPLSFTVGIYIGKTVDGVTKYSLVEQQSKTGVASDEAYFNFRLIKGLTYKLVAYADFATTAKDSLESISYTTALNNELDDAFFVSQDFVAKDHVGAVLKRPFGKLRLIARDFNTFAAGEKFEITDVSVSYKNQPMLSTTQFNALTGEFNYDKNAKGDTTVNNAAPSYALEFDENGNAEYAAIFTHYLPANFGEEDKSGTYKPVDEEMAVPQSWMYPLEVTVKYKDENGTESSMTRSYDMDIPVKRNWLTTLDVSDFFTENTTVMLTVDHRFDGFITEELPIVEYVNDEDELVDAIDKIVYSDAHKGKIIIGKDITIDHHIEIELYGYGHDVTVTVDLNGHTIEQTTKNFVNDEGVTQQASSVFLIYGGNYVSDLIIEDSSKEGTGAVLSVDKEACKDVTTFFCQFGGKVVINGGTIKCSGENHALYSYDWKAYMSPESYGFIRASEIVVNGGWIENIDGDTKTDQWGLPTLATTLVNIYNNATNGNIGIVHLNGGSYVDYNPSNGDNITGNHPNPWVDEDHEVISETIDGHTVYTIIPKTTPNYY